MAKQPRIGALRWPVIIAARIQQPSGTNSIIENLDNPIHVHADIQSLGPMAFLGSEATDRPITDRIIIRWLDWLDLTFIIIRNTARADRTTRQEVFRIRKIAEWDGRKRYLEILAEKEFRS